MADRGIKVIAAGRIMRKECGGRELESVFMHGGARIRRVQTVPKGKKLHSICYTAQ
ncbi:MAG: hypothetical protein AAB482_03895 [Patescibacteria group bacterium]